MSDKQAKTPGDTRPQNRSRSRSPTETEGSLFKDILSLFLKIGGILLAFLLIFTFLFGLIRTPDAAMTPAIKDGDLVIYYRLDKHYTLGDAIVLKQDGRQHVRRVVATAGDTVTVTDDGLKVNGALQQEPEIVEKTHAYEAGVHFPITLKEGQIFVLGDAREHADDSRIYGPIKVGDTQGKVITLLRRRHI